MSFEVVTLSAFSTAALFFTGWSNTMDSGWAMPTVVFLPGARVSLFTLPVAAVVNPAVSVPPPVPLASTRYVVPGAAGRSEVQVPPSGESRPVRAVPSPAETVTVRSFPAAGVTVTGRPAVAASPRRFTEIRMALSAAFEEPVPCALPS